MAGRQPRTCKTTAIGAGYVILNRSVTVDVSQLTFALRMAGCAVLKRPKSAS